MVAIGRVGQLRVSGESSIGVPAGGYSCVRVAGDLPNFPSIGTLVPNHVRGHQHPHTVEKPEYINMCVENAFSFDVHIRRAAAAGGIPDFMRFLKSAGWDVQASTGATTTTGTPTVSSIQQTSNVTGESQFVLIERSSGVHVPVLVSALTGATITPHVRMSAAPATGAAINPMHTATPATATGFGVPSDATLAFKLNTHGQYDDAQGDLALDMIACAMASMGEITIERVGTPIMASTTWHGVSQSITPDDIAADVFVDSDQFALVTDDMEIAIQAADEDGNIVLVSGSLVRATINPGIATVPVYVSGGGTFGGIIGYQAVPTAPTINLVANFNGTSTWEKNWVSQLTGSNVSQSVHIFQPTRNISRPAFAVSMPNCHIMAGGEPTFDIGQDTIQMSVGFTASCAGIGGDTLVSERGAAPIYIGISGAAS